MMKKISLSIILSIFFLLNVNAQCEQACFDDFISCIEDHAFALYFCELTCKDLFAFDPDSPIWTGSDSNWMYDHCTDACDFAYNLLVEDCHNDLQRCLDEC